MFLGDSPLLISRSWYKEALRIAQTAILAGGACITQVNIIINIDCLYCCNMAWEIYIVLYYTDVYVY